MKPSKPPALAAWMLDHLLWGGRNDALAGDLLEEFRRRGSVAWYRRQVFRAILARFSNEARADWVMVWTIVFSLVWGYSLYAIPPIAAPRDVFISLALNFNHYLAAHGYYRTHTWSAVGYLYSYGIPILFHMVVPLCVYLAGTRNLDLRTIARGICVGVLLMTVMQHLHFQPLLDYLSMHGLAYYWVQLWRWYEVFFQFLPLLAAMWAAQSGQRETRAIPISA